MTCRPSHEFLKEIDGVFHLYERVRKLNTNAHCLGVPSDRKEGHNEGADTSCVRVIFQRESLQLAGTWLMLLKFHKAQIKYELLNRVRKRGWFIDLAKKNYFKKVQTIDKMWCLGDEN